MKHESRFKTRKVGAVLALGMSASIAGTAYAGSGVFGNGEFDMCVSVRFDATPDELDTIRSVIQEGSDVLADATDGQHRFGTVTLVNDSGASRSSEYWIHPGDGRPTATQGLYGTRGEHVNLFFDCNFVANDPGSAYTIAHEHAHHAYALLDEYLGPMGSAEDAPPPDTADLNYSLLDNFFDRGGRANGGNYTLNEFCVAANHDPDGDTFQEALHGESAWETLENQMRFPIMAPAGLPIDEPPASVAVSFLEGFGGLSAMLLIDRSGSMNIDRRLEFAKLGSNVFIDLLEDDDAMGVSSFSSTTSVDFPLAPVNDTTRAGARSAVDAFFAFGTTNIGGGLQTALGELTAQTQRACNEIIILLSDGDHNTGPTPESVLPLVQAEAVTVLTVGVGSGISTEGEAELQSIASQTGGRFFRIADASDLTMIFLEITAESTGAGLLTRAPVSVESDQTVESEVLIEPGVESAVFAMTQDLASDDVDFTLNTPTGDTIDPSSESSPGIQVIENDNATIYEIANPEPGIWQLVVNTGTVSSGELDLVGFATSPGVQLTLNVDDDEVSFPDPIVVRATPTIDGIPVTGATVAGSVNGPDGSTESIVLSDDGSGADVVADDGYYAASFDGYSEDGTYTIELFMDTEGAQKYGGELLFASAGHPSNAAPVTRAVRVSSTTAVVMDSDQPPIDCQRIEFIEERLLGRTNSRERTGTYPITPLDGEYELVLTSIDQLHPQAGENQSNEIWVLEGLNIAGEVILETTPTDDLPENDTINSTSVGNYDVSDVRLIRARHAFISDEFNSIVPLSVTFKNDECTVR